MLPLAKIRYLKSQQLLRSGEKLCQAVQSLSCSPEWEFQQGKDHQEQGEQLFLPPTGTVQQGPSAPGRIIHISLRVILLLLAASFPDRVLLCTHFCDVVFHYLSVWTVSFRHFCPRHTVTAQ